jgi:hypothetical protein
MVSSHLLFLSILLHDLFLRCNCFLATGMTASSCNDIFLPMLKHLCTFNRQKYVGGEVAAFTEDVNFIVWGRAQFRCWSQNVLRNNHHLDIMWFCWCCSVIHVVVWFMLVMMFNLVARPYLLLWLS